MTSFILARYEFINTIQFGGTIPRLLSVCNGSRHFLLVLSFSSMSHSRRPIFPLFGTMISKFLIFCGSTFVQGQHGGMLVALLPQSSMVLGFILSAVKCMFCLCSCGFHLLPSVQKHASIQTGYAKLPIGANECRPISPLLDTMIGKLAMQNCL